MCFWLCCSLTLICFFISALLRVIPLRQQHNKSWAVTWWGTVRSAQVSWEQTGGGNLSLCVCLCFLKEAELRAAVMVDVIDLWACSGIWKKKKMHLLIWHHTVLGVIVQTSAVQTRWGSFMLPCCSSGWMKLVVWQHRCPFLEDPSN